MFYFDPLYMLVMLVTLGLSLWATAKVKYAFNHYRRIAASSGLSGREVAERILQHAGVDAHVGPVAHRALFRMGGDGGDLSDHYDPRTREVKLSPHVYNGTSVAALAIAAHEVGHAIQHAQGYAPLMIRNTIAPAAAFGSNMAYVFIMLGAIMSFFSLIKLGILLFGIAVAFQLITLPVEFDASRRAKQLLHELGIITVQAEGKGVAAVLNAAALTYVAAAATALLNLAYLLLRFRDR